jgi:hypothetical protein
LKAQKQRFDKTLHDATLFPFAMVGSFVRAPHHPPIGEHRPAIEAPTPPQLMPPNALSIGNRGGLKHVGGACESE